MVEGIPLSVFFHRQGCATTGARDRMKRTDSRVGVPKTACRPLMNNKNNLNTFLNFEFRSFGFVSDFELRISDLYLLVTDLFCLKFLKINNPIKPFQ